MHILYYDRLLQTGILKWLPRAFTNPSAEQTFPYRLSSFFDSLTPSGKGAVFKLVSLFFCDLQNLTCRIWRLLHSMHTRSQSLRGLMTRLETEIVSKVLVNHQKILVFSFCFACVPIFQWKQCLYKSLYVWYSAYFITPALIISSIHSVNHDVESSAFLYSRAKSNSIAYITI